jgi:signal transduction histidine kinase
MPREDEAGLVTADGAERVIAWRNSDIRDSLGEVAGILAFGIDVTPQRHAEAEWRITFDAVNTPILIVLPDGVVARLNRSAKELLHREFREIIGQPLSSLTSDEPWITAARMVEFGDLAAGATVETKDGVGRTWDISVARYMTNDRITRRILVLWDISSVVELQESLRRSETMSAMGTLVAGVAHEVRNPLFGISATLDAFAEELERPELIEFGRNIGREVKRLTRLMQDLLEYGKLPLLSISSGSIMLSVQEAVRNSMRDAQAAEVTLSIEAEDGLPDVLIDAGRMRQVFENLISNGIQHSPPGGSVRTVVRSAQRGGLAFIEARIEDEGSGFNPDDLDRIFEPFFTRREGGTGLGLSIVQRIIEEHAGTVEAGNRAGGGAVITLWLPAAAWSREAPPPHPPGAASA